MTHVKNGEADHEWLVSNERPRKSTGTETITAADVFCGSGGMTVGLEEACRRQRIALDVRLALDSDPVACRVFKANFPKAKVVATDVGNLLDGGLGDSLSATEERLRNLGPIAIAYGGPPCAGHSDLNNHTRRNDPKNALYLTMARLAEVLRPKLIVIENVPPVLWDSENVVDGARRILEKSNYSVHGQVLDVSRLGVPQRRRRYILLASAIDTVDPFAVLSQLAKKNLAARNLRWAIGDLEKIHSSAEIDRPSSMSPENRKRVGYLFRYDKHDLPNSHRPKCHRDKDHSYKSMYGRLWWDKPAQTITTGFTSMGQGRYVHPRRPRTLTPHEAARLQTFPDWFDWSAALHRTALARLIGNAVPPLLMARLGELVLPSLIA